MSSTTTRLFPNNGFVWSSIETVVGQSIGISFRIDSAISTISSLPAFFLPLEKARTTSDWASLRLFIGSAEAFIDNFAEVSAVVIAC